jgi:hypothetical protein
MRRLFSAICAGLILGTGLLLAFGQPADDAQQKLQGTWTATKADVTAKQPMTLSVIGSPLPATAFRSCPRTASPSTREPSG